MKNLVLGKGLIGSELADVLKGKGEEVAVLSRSNGQDLKNTEQYLEKFQRADRVWFLAWEVGVWKKDTAPAYEAKVLDSNLRLCQSVFGCLEKTKKPFLFVSSQAAPSPDMGVLGVTKRVGEMWTRILGGHIARLWNVYGWEAPGEKSHLVPDLAVQGLEGKIRLMTSGEEVRQFLNVRDCAEAFVRQMETGQEEADVTSWEWVPVKEVARRIGEKLGAEVEFGAKPGRPPYLEPRIKLKSWKPRISLNAGLDEVIAKAKAWRAAAKRA